MRSYFLIILLISSLYTSCEKEVGMIIPPHDPKIVVNSIFSEGEKWNVHVTKSKQILDQTEFEILTNASVDLYEDEILLESLTYIGDGIYESTQTPKIGKVYTLRVASDGLDLVRAESEILSPVQIKRISKAQKRYESLDYTELSIVFSDDEKVANYYNVSLYEYEGETVGNCEFFGTPFYFASVDNELKIGDILDTNSVEYFDQDGAAFNDLLFNGTNYTLKLLIENRHIDSIDVAMVEIKSLSKNYYEYITTRTAYILAQGDPFSQPVYVKSNIENGYGIFAGYSNTWDCIPLK